MTADLLPRLQSALGSHYAVERELGRGGMATVYLARDLRHDRPVALKVLHPELAAVIGAERFLAEIRVTANLQHPHILPLFDSGHAAELLYYVMPFVSGESLRARLVRETQLPVEDAVRIAKEVAFALDYAHRHGVIHRDIKPENILLHDGTALVADFGIALAVTRAGGNRLTQTGLSLGTPHYMSPEQAMGDREIDGRSDVYALGAVVYEMLVGEPPFTGPSSQAVIAKLLTEPPPAVTAARRATPPHVAAALHRAMQKLPADRFASAADFRSALSESSSTLTALRDDPAHSHRSSQRTRAVVSLMALAVFLGIVAVAGWSRSTVQSPGRVVRFEFETLDSNGIPLVMDVSPDGSRILIVERAGGRIRLFARELGSLATARLQASDRGPGWPFFSPDGTEFGFTSVSVANELIGTLRTAAIAGGPARTLVDSVLAQAGWGDDGFIYYARASRAGHSVLARVASTGGRPDTLVHSDSISFVQPHPLPGSRGLLMIAKGADGTTRLCALNLLTRKWRPLVASGYFIAYDSSGYVLFDQGQSLMAAPFDARQMELTAPPVPVAQVASGAFGAFAMAGGTLTYLSTASGGLENVPLLADRKGRKRRLESLPPGQFYGFPAASPDGRRIALRVEDAAAGRSQPDIWVYQLPGGPLTRLTFDGSNDDASWTPDGTRVLFQSNRDGTNALWLEPWDGTGEAEKVLDRGKEVWRTSWLPDGRRFLFDEQRGEGTTDLSSGTADVGIAILGQPDSARLLLTGQFDETWPAASPDGRWLAYQSSESGRDEIYVRPLDRAGTRRQLSRSGGRMPVWARSGRELFFVSSSGDSLAAVRLDTSKDAEVLGERMLFPLRHASDGYDVLPGDSLFVLVEPKENDRERASVVVVSNFATELRARMAGR